MAILRLKDIKRVFSNGFVAVQEMNLTIEQSDFVAFVGPEGCGKTTVLRMIAGLEDISSGELYIDDKQANHLPPTERNIALVLRNNALYPLLNVFDNLAFGLKLHNIPRTEIEPRVRRAAAVLQMENILDQKPDNLTEKQKSLINLGRAIVREPKAYLMDDPLRNLEPQARKEVREEIMRLHKELNSAFVYVTQDPAEAIRLATKIVVMNDGIIQQTDTPEVLINNPANLFVASFMSKPELNVMEIYVRESGSGYCLEFGSGKLELPESKTKNLSSYVNKEVLVAIRPQDFTQESDFTLSATVLASEIIDDAIYHHLHCEGHNFSARLNFKPNIGEMIKLPINPEKVCLFDRESQKNICLK